MEQKENWVSTQDGFSLCLTPMADLLEEMGITNTGISSINPRDVQSYYDDWHLFRVHTVYGLLKMREQEYDYVPGFADGDDPGITISFVPFSLPLLENLSDPQKRAENLPPFVHGFRQVTDLPGQVHDPIIQKYFSDPTAQAPYLIADCYIRKLLTLVQDGKLPLPNRMTRASRLVRTRTAQLNSLAGHPICDPENHCINIRDPQNPTEQERYSLLVAHTGSPSFNAFAAEVKYHADALVGWEAHLPIVGKKIWYAAAIRADMQVDPDIWVRNQFFAPYYKENSRLVRQQAELHGKQ